MNIGVSYVGFYLKPFEEFVSAAATKKFTRMELIPDQAPNLYSEFPRNRIKTLLRLKEAHDLHYSVHNVFYDINLLSLEPHVADFAFHVTDSVMTFASAIEAGSITVHPGYMFPGWRRDPRQGQRFWDNASYAMERLGKLAEKRGIRVLLENGGYCVTTNISKQRTPLSVGVTSEEMRKLLKLTPPNIGMAMDLGKAVHSGEEFVNWFRICIPRLNQLQIGSDRYLDSHGEWLAKMLKCNSRAVDVVIEAPLKAASTVRQKLLERWGI